MAQHGRDSDFARALKSGRWEQLSTGIDVISVPVALFYPIVSLALLSVVALLWVVPDLCFARVAEQT